VDRMAGVVVRRRCFRLQPDTRQSSFIAEEIVTPTPVLYSLHERIWHWLQAAGIGFLILTGFAIHYPDRFGVLGSMANAVRWHTWIGVALVVNAFLGIFYHATAEKYHHFLPRMDDFTDAAIRQAHFYFYGIFHGEKHPLETDPRRKLNSLQKITYLLLLNVLLPFQIVTGVLLWGADLWPILIARLGACGSWPSCTHLEATSS